MKKILAMAAVAALAAGASAYAANPFADVSTSDWAYQAVADLSDQGIVEGYPDGTFKGETNITRYEMAQIIARLMAKEDQYNAEQRATIDKLAGEYADELDTLGVRVSNLEKKVGNISWSGDSRMRFIRTTDGNDAWQGRVRITAQGQVNEDTKVVGRFTSGNVDFKNDAGNSNDGDVSMDRMYVQHQFGDKVAVTLGRYEVDMGTQACWLYGNAFDGAEAQINFNDDYSLKFGFGRFKDAKGDYKEDDKPTIAGDEFGDAEAFYAQAKANFGFAKLGVDYFRTSDFKVWGETDGTTKTESANVIGANLLVPVGDFRVFGDYYKDTDAQGDPQIWGAGIGYGAMDLQKPGTFDIDVAYYDVEEGVYHYNMSGLDIDGTMFEQDGNFWLATADVTLMKNMYLRGEWMFAYDRDNSSDEDLHDAFEIALNYVF